MQVFSDPAYPGLGAAPFVTASQSNSLESVFDNGLPLAHTDWVKDGSLGALLQTRHSAGLTEQPVTPYIDNLVVSVDGASGSTEDLVAGMDDGLLLTCLWYIREVDPQTLLLTGLTRDGVYKVENGEVVGAVNNFRFNESPVGLLDRIAEASATGLASRASGATTSRGPPPRRSASPTSTCPPSPRPSRPLPEGQAGWPPGMGTSGSYGVRV